MNVLTSNRSVVAEDGALKALKLLVVDDDESIRGLLRTRLSDSYQIVETGDPEQALALALEHKPDAILLDLMMPGFSGFELCQSFHTLSYTSRIPIFVITGEAGTKYKEHCESLGARGYFQKPVDFAALKGTLAQELKGKIPERRAHKRVQMRVVLGLRGSDASGKEFSESVTTENISAGGFLCNCSATLVKGTAIDVFLASGGHERYAGRAQVVRKDAPGSPWQRYGFQFIETTADWVLQGK
ncbi:MAG TPA: response regulator [Verrucomicrobiae bacterium]|nr:response regulator [Verrucomicrobiae bacterium]